ncbi:hypothetical protein [Vibrio crassostreae]|uniref:hypothetical protein n=1 Tax=Vibrio crassostreae TaxID=246167 RepID=UPI000630E4A8|nr:hypothetical protein [Vibrio crassostreae]TCN96143.1 hypothetical protein EDB30_11835 [Vibrio crassostreae]CAK1814906.1 exported hypothetical protein [Vibrio crassostreae]CAK1816532.1 exported hypothetical protein [Vibrio crassostreae]CAK2435154.1 exported hypothetical protein [Vibrio crassostreae]CAK3216549.1 exported hypothetical protein [Vibrio crassostreae]
MKLLLILLFGMFLVGCVAGNASVGGDGNATGGSITSETDVDTDADVEVKPL